MTRPELEISNVEHIASQFPDSRVMLVSNVENEKFDNYKPSHSNIIKYVSNKKYSISKAVNVGIKDFIEDFFVFVQSDITVDREAILHFRDIANRLDKVGVIGVKNHSGFNTFNKPIPFPDTKLYRVLWADAIMFIPKDVVKEVGLFNEDYLGDKESQEYCYRAHNLGYSNLYVEASNKGTWKHRSIGFPSKVSSKDTPEFLQAVEASRNLFRERWSIWEEEQRRFFS